MGIKNPNWRLLTGLVGPTHAEVLRKQNNYSDNKVGGLVRAIAKTGKYLIRQTVEVKNAEGVASMVEKDVEHTVNPSEAVKRMQNLFAGSINAGHTEIGPDFLPRRK